MSSLLLFIPISLDSVSGLLDLSKIMAGGGRDTFQHFKMDVMRMGHTLGSFVDQSQTKLITES